MYRVHSGILDGLEQLLAYYHLKDVRFPPEASGIAEKVAYLNESTQLICVPGALEGKWYRVLSCPILALNQEGLCHMVLPDWLGRAYYISAESGRKVYVTKKNQSRFQRECYVVQQDLLEDKPALGTALGRLLRGMGVFETVTLVLWSALGGGLLLLLGELLQRGLANAALHSGSAAVWAQAAGLAVMILGGLLLLYGEERIVRRISQRAALGLLPALGERLWFSIDPDDPAGQADCLAGLRAGGEMLTRWGLTPLCGLAAGLLPAAGLVKLSPRLLWAAVITFWGLTLAAAAAAGLCARRRPEAQAGAAYEWLESRASDKRFGVRRDFPFGRRGGIAASGLLGLTLPLLMTPVLFIAAEEGLALSELAQAAVLYLPAAAFPLAMWKDAAGVGRGIARLRELLGRTARRFGHERDLPKPGSALELKNVTFTYPGRREPVLRDVELRIFPGEVLGICGGTGSGKTTLARIMTGLLTPDAGNVYYGGIELARYERESILRRIALDSGEDIRLLERAPEGLDGRTTVIFSSREEELACCERIFDLSAGRLTLREQKERYF